MKIAVDARTMASRPSGVGAYLSDFLKALFLKEGFDFILITDVAESESIRFFSGHGVPVFCYGKRVFRSAGVFPYFLFLRKVLLAEAPDCFWEPNNLIPVSLKGFRGKVLLTVHDIFPITMPQYFSRYYRLYFRTGIMRSLRRADAVLFNSEETRREAEGRFPFLRQVPGLVSHLIVPAPPEREISDEGFFLYIGNLERRKGTDLLIRAWCSYREQGGNRPLYLCGSVRENEIAVLLGEAEKRFSGIRYPGYVTEEKKYDLLSKCHCFLFPSGAEGFGLPPLEAAGYGKPVLTSDLSVFREVLGGYAQTFPSDVDGEEQVRILSRMLLEDRFRPPADTEGRTGEGTEGMLNRYTAEVLSERLAGFLYEIIRGGEPDRDAGGEEGEAV